MCKQQFSFFWSAQSRVHPHLDSFSGAQALAPQGRAWQQSSQSQLPMKRLDHFLSIRLRTYSVRTSFDANYVPRENSKSLGCSCAIDCDSQLEMHPRETK